MTIKAAKIPLPSMRIRFRISLLDFFTMPSQIAFAIKSYANFLKTSKVFRVLGARFMRIAILGAGFAGLATCWYLLHYTKASAAIDIYDPYPIGQSASGLSSGLLHAYPGKQAKRAWEADRAIRETHRLLTEASRASGHSLLLSKGILRPAINEEIQLSFQATAGEYPDVEWWDRTKCEKSVPGLQLAENQGALFIKEGLAIDAIGYLRGLWQACALFGTQFYQRPIKYAEELERYDRILIAIGASTKYFLPLKNIPQEVVKGQILELAWPKEVPPLPFSLNADKYLVMNKEKQTCWAGATYEHEFTSAAPEQEKAIQSILPRISAFFPPLANAKVVNCVAGFRATTPNHLPLTGRVLDKYYFFTGLGSKGLLYHALVARSVARAMLTRDESNFIEKLHYRPE
jgi:glycine/D-amino acid oxidase-like deaminating enzyme